MNATSSPSATPLGLDADALNTCVGCGLCLPHCPTFRVTGEEALSPRGRIAAMRAVEWQGAPIDADFVDFMATCVQCRGCEPACPSGVPYGRLIEGTRTRLAATGKTAPWWQRWAYAVLPRHRLILAGSTALAVAQRVRLVPARLGLGRLPLRRGPAVRATAVHTPDVWLFTGCVMDAWLRDTHRATARVLDAIGVRYAVPGRGGGCCGALHVHAGLHAQSQRLAERVIASMPGDAPVLVNSAGCGAALKEYGELLGTPEAHAFSARVFDVLEWLEPRLDDLPLTPRAAAVIVQDPCHLRHVQRAHVPVRAALARIAELVELDDEGLCCGAGGAYSALEPELAGKVRERKLDTIDRALRTAGTRPTVVASANPGCVMHLGDMLAARGLAVAHPIDLLAEALPDGAGATR